MILEAQPFARILLGRGVTGETVTLRDRKVGPNEHIRYFNLFYVNDTTATSDIIWGIRTAEGFVQLVSLGNVALVSGSTVTGRDLVLGEGMQLELQISQTVDGDRLTVGLHGQVEIVERREI